MIRPIHTFYFIFCVVSIVIIIAVLNPKENYLKIPKIGKFPFFAPKVFAADKEFLFPKKKSINNEEQKKIKVSGSKIAKEISIEYPNHDNTLLYPFFESLDNIYKKRKGIVRILHFGDSQIEGDRITEYLRKELQKKFGNGGLGLLPAVPLAKRKDVEIIPSDNWKRYALFGNSPFKKNVKHFGLMGISCKYFGKKGELNIHPYLGNPYFTKCRVFYGFNNKSLFFNSYVSGKLFLSYTLLPSNELKTFTFNYKNNPKDVKLKFIGKDSPEVFAISFENDNGIIVDNIPMRGSAGLEFTKMNRKVLSKMLYYLAPSLIILQYGGNTVPYLNSKQRCENYGNSFKRQLFLLKRLYPKASFLVIGPADMLTKINGSLDTYPYLEEVIQSLKKASFDANVPFFDLYNAMGGRRSMLKWVNSTPPLASTDYIHFNRMGADKIANIILSELLKEYDKFHKNKDKNLISSSTFSSK